MHFLKLLFKGAVALALLGAAAGVIGASGCGSYIPHEPEVPGIVNPGGDPENPGGDTQEPEKIYPPVVIQIVKTFGEEPEYEYEGELNGYRITLDGITGMCLLVIAADGGVDFPAGTHLTLFYEGGPAASYIWYEVTDGSIADAPIEFTDGSAAVVLEQGGGVCCLIEGAQQKSYDIDLTITLTT